MMRGREGADSSACVSASAVVFFRVPGADDEADEDSFCRMHGWVPCNRTARHKEVRQPTSGDEDGTEQDLP